MEINTEVRVEIVMGSHSDWETLQFTAKTLTTLQIPHHARVISAHRTPNLLFSYAQNAGTTDNTAIIIAGAGGAAHLPGMLAAITSLPVLGVPILSKALHGMDSLLSIVQMPAGIPVGTMAIGKPGAINAALLAAAILAPHYPAIKNALQAYRAQQTARVLQYPDPLHPPACE